ncbi:MAG: dTMP kinase [Ignavibacteria bacterium]
MFITFEGIDLSGKSTQAKLLFLNLRKLKFKTLLIREPGGTLISEKIRSVLLDSQHKKMEYLTEFLLFSASRYQLTNEVIIPHLKKGYYVICDRYYDSSTAYQGYGGNLDLKTVKFINKVATRGLKPKLTFLLDIPYSENLRRRQKLSVDKDRIESKSLSYYKRVIQGFRTIALEEKTRVTVLDGKKTVKELSKIILEKVLQYEK